MKKGGGKAKGGAFERQIAKSLSSWLTGGRREDILWRSAMSGGRATVAHKKGQVDEVVGDICAVAPEGNRFISSYLVECKNYKHLDLGCLVFPDYTDKTLSNFWVAAYSKAREVGKHAMLIFKSDRRPILVLTSKLPNTFALGYMSDIKSVTINGQGVSLLTFEDLIHGFTFEDG